MDELTMNTPTRDEINIHDSPDEQAACEHFLGKSVSEAQDLFADASMTYQEDLMWMGPKAYAYYLPAALGYLVSEASIGDDSFVDAMLNNFEFRREQPGFELVVSTVCDVLDYVVQSGNKFEIDQVIYGDLVARARALRVQFHP